MAGRRADASSSSISPWDNMPSARRSTRRLRRSIKDDAATEAVATGDADFVTVTGKWTKGAEATPRRGDSAVRVR